LRRPVAPWMATWYERHMPSHPIDGTLPPWQDIARTHPWAALLIGNGLSINVWPNFGYGSRALGHAIRQVHLTRSQVPESTLAAIRSELTNYEYIFTTSYDLIVYWAMGYGERFAPFVDLFKYGGRCEFDPARAGIYLRDWRFDWRNALP
jgi:hypothetical protein